MVIRPPSGRRREVPFESLPLATNGFEGSHPDDEVPAAWLGVRLSAGRSPSVPAAAETAFAAPRRRGLVEERAAIGSWLR